MKVQVNGGLEYYESSTTKRKLVVDFEEKGRDRVEAFEWEYGEKHGD